MMRATAVIFGLACLLPANANPNAVLGPALQKAGFNCTPDKARGIGQTPKETVLEVSCAGGSMCCEKTSIGMSSSTAPERPVCATFSARGMTSIRNFASSTRQTRLQIGR